MASSFTPNKNIEQPAHGDYPNTWDVPVNADWTVIDNAFGGTTNKNATGLSGNITLATAEYTTPSLQISGAPSAAVTYVVPSGVGGVWIVRNATTGGKVVGIKSNAGGATVAIPANMQLAVWCDGTAAGMRVANSGFQSDGIHFPDATIQITAAKTSFLYQQTFQAGSVTINNSTPTNGPTTGSIGVAGDKFRIFTSTTLIDVVDAAAFRVQLTDGSATLITAGVTSFGINAYVTLYMEYIATLTGPTTFTVQAFDLSRAVGGIMTSNVGTGGNTSNYIIAQQLP